MSSAMPGSYIRYSGHGDYALMITCSFLQSRAASPLNGRISPSDEWRTKRGCAIRSPADVSSHGSGLPSPSGL